MKYGVLNANKQTGINYTFEINDNDGNVKFKIAFTIKY
jgi:hypothetical protein